MHASFYKRFVAEVGLRLRREGFSKKTASFYFPNGQNYLVLSFQKSMKLETRDVFTLNIGVFIKSLQEFMEIPQLQSPPHCSEGQFYERISVFLEDCEHDFWWRIGNEAELAKALDDIEWFLNERLDFLKDSTDESLFLNNLVKNDKLMSLNTKYIYGAYLSKKLRTGELGMFAGRIKGIIAADASEKTRKKFQYFLDKLEILG